MNHLLKKFDSQENSVTPPAEFKELNKKFRIICYEGSYSFFVTEDNGTYSLFDRDDGLLWQDGFKTLEDAAKFASILVGRGRTSRHPRGRNELYYQLTPQVISNLKQMLEDGINIKPFNAHVFMLDEPDGKIPTIVKKYKLEPANIIHYGDVQAYQYDLENRSGSKKYHNIGSYAGLMKNAHSSRRQDIDYKYSNNLEIEEKMNMNSIYDLMNKIDDKESLNEKYNVRTLKDVKKLQESVNSTMITESTNETDVAIDWYCATGAADADGWPDEPLGDNEDFITAALDWWDTHKHIYGYDRKRTGSRKTNRAVIFYEDLLNLVKKNLSNLNIVDDVHISCPGHMWQIELQVGQKFNPTIVQCSEMHGKDSISLYPWKKFSDNDISWDFDNRKEIMINPASNTEELAKQIVDHVRCEVSRYKDTFNESLSEEHSDAWKAAYSKLNRAADDAKLHMDADFVEYALEDDGAYVEDVIENEVTYVGDVLKKEFPNLAYWKFLQDERFSSAIQVYSRPKNSRRFSDVTFEGNYELAHDRLYPIDVE